MASVVRDNLMNTNGYSPYCGNVKCRLMPRTNFDGQQFVCKCCNWRSGFDEEFIKAYREKWGLPDNIDISKSKVNFI